MHGYYHTRRHDSAALSWKHEAISKTLPLLYLRIHGYDCETRNGLYRMSRLGLIAAIPGKGLTNGLLLRRAAECVTVTREDECLTSNKAYSSFFFLLPERVEIRLRYAQRPYLCTLKHAASKNGLRIILRRADGQWLTPSDLNCQAHSPAILLSDWYRVDYSDRKKSLLKMNDI